MDTDNTTPPQKSVEFARLPERLTEAQAAQYLGKSIFTLRRYRKNGLIGFGRIGRDVYFRAQHLAEFLEQSECPPSSTA